MSIPLSDVRHMARLSMLEISPEEENLFAAQFGRILEHMEILRNVDTKDIEPMYTPVFQTCALRPDNPENIRTRAEVLSCAPETDGEAFIVPRIV